MATRSTRGRLLLLLAFAGIALAAVSLTVHFSADRRARRTLARLAAHQSDAPLTTARLTRLRIDDRAERGPASTIRGVEELEGLVELQRLAEGTRSARVLHALGLASLATGRLADGFSALDEAVRLDRDNDPDIAADLGAALLDRGVRTSQGTDIARALDQVSRALELNAGHSAALFIRALALDHLGLSDWARDAWTEFLGTETDTRWTVEGRARLAALAATDMPSVSDVEAANYETLGLLARKSPGVLYAFVERNALPRWGRASLAGKDSSLAQARQAASALVAAGRDRWPADAVTAAMDLSSAFGPRRLCAARAFVALEDWHAAYEAGIYADMNRLADAAIADFECAGVAASRGVATRALSLITEGRTAEALSSLERIRAGATIHGYLRDLAVVHYINGTAALQETRMSDSAAHTAAATDLATRAGDDELLAVTAASRATTLANQGDRPAAWKQLAESARAAQGVASFRRRYQVWARISALAEQSGLPSMLGAVGELMRVEARRSRAPWGEVAANLQLARAAALASHWSVADVRLNEARTLAPLLLDPMFRAEAMAEVSLTEGRVYLAQDPSRAVKALSEGLRSLEERGNHTRTSGVLLARGRAWARAGRWREAESDWERGIALLEAQRTSINDTRRRIARTADTWSLFDELIASQLARRDPSALSTLERGHAQELLAALSTDGPRPSGPGNATWLPSDWSVITYWVGPTTLAVWTITAAGTELWQQSLPAGTLDRLTREQAEALRRGQAPSPELARYLLPPGLRPSRVLVFVPDASLHQVAFAALRLDDGRNLVDTTVPVVVPSLAVLKLLLERPARAVGLPTLTGVSAGEKDAGLPPLPGVRRELDSVVRLYPTGTRVFDQDSVTTAGLREALRQASVFSFSGHAVANTVQPFESYLWLGERAGRLMVADIERMKMPEGSVVVLGACETAGGQVFRGEGALSLARPFLIAGASYVIAPLWPVNDAAAERFLKQLHERLARGQSAAIALAETQRTEARSGFPSNDWAGYQLIGRG